MEDVQKHSVHTLVFRSLKRTHDMFLSDQANPPPVDDESDKIKMKCKVNDEYSLVKNMPVQKENKKNTTSVTGPYHSQDWQSYGDSTEVQGSHPYPSGPGVTDSSSKTENRTSKLRIEERVPGTEDRGTSKALVAVGQQQALVPKKAPTMPKPSWHPPWKLFRVLSGHVGWVRCIAVEPANEWFATGSGDRMIKIWDLATGNLKLSLTGHISTVRGLAVSHRQPYLFSCGEDKQVKCWDLEYNKVIRHYHGHLSACHALALHPTIDVLISCGRDATARVWDIRTKACIHTMTGHTNTVADVRCQAADPQVITGSHDCTVRLWDLAAGKTRATLTNHKKSVRGLALHPSQFTFASASPDNIKQWKFPDGNFIQNLSGHNAIVNCLALNNDGVLVSGGDNGTMFFWDWRSGYNFQRLQAAAQPGSIDSEAGIFAMEYDKSGSRLITAEADKTVKIYKEDDTATEDSHPLNWRPDILRKKRY